MTKLKKRLKEIESVIYWIQIWKWCKLDGSPFGAHILYKTGNLNPLNMDSVNYNETLKWMKRDSRVQEVCGPLPATSGHGVNITVTKNPTLLPLWTRTPTLIHGLISSKSIKHLKGTISSFKALLDRTDSSCRKTPHQQLCRPPSCWII